jgi:3-oxoacyl-[acyl-carrier protein] reductase
MKLGTGTKAIVTGAASGIGKATVLALARKGVALWLVDIDGSGLQSVADQVQTLGASAETTICDLLQPGAVDELVARIRQHWPNPNILINSAGVAAYGATHEMGEAAWDRVIGINLNVPIKLTNALLPTLIAQPEAHVVNLCSIFGLTSMPQLAAYQTSKFGLVGYSLALDAEYGRRGFGVTAVCPGIVRTPMIARMDVVMAQSQVKIPSWIGLTAETVARRIVRAIETDAGLIVIAPTAHLLWWITRLAPGFTRWLHRGKWITNHFLQRLPPPAK